jgi:glycosyltransferase involved in cell wall biosynthesis
MINQALLTVGMPVYNGEQFLRPAIDSILNQTFSNFLLLISDNGSTDNTRHICEEYAQRDERVRYLREEINRGAVWNFNRLAQLATTAYFVWHSADDEASPEYLETCMALLVTNPDAVLAYTGAMILDASGSLVLSANRPRVEVLTTLGRFCSCLSPFPYSDNVLYGVIRTKAIRQTRYLGGFSGSDRAFLSELSLYGAFVRSEEVLFRRRLHTTRTETAQSLEEYNQGKYVRFSLREWNILWWNLRSVSRVPNLPEGRWPYFVQLFQRVWDKRSIYLQEIRSTLKELIMLGRK